jgi:uncharacterized membrane protein YheB (UPF0754 family)
MLLWISHPLNWTLPLGGAVVGFVTNWIAIKVIFQPVDPINIGFYELQGIFPGRQKQVSEEMSDYIAKNLLTSQEIWKSMLLRKCARDEFENIIKSKIPFLSSNMVQDIMNALDQELLKEEDILNYKNTVKLDVGDPSLSTAQINSLPNPESQLHLQTSHDNTNETMVHGLHEYSNIKIELRNMLTARLNSLTSSQFERILHPVFEEEENTLIIAGKFLFGPRLRYFL